MPETPSPRHRLTGLNPGALMAHGLAGDSPQEVEVVGIEIETPLGRGGMGAVYLGRQVSLDREVAVKVLARELADDPMFLERLEREARVMARLRHPNIVTVHDFQRTDDGAAIVMEFVAGGSLREKMRSHPNGLPVAEALSILRQIAAGLEAAHEAGIIHRDMKPENVLIDDDGTARVTDFGIALPLNEKATRLTLTGTTIGTVDYMAPEQFRSDEADARLDVYALGVMAYELLTGRTPRGSFDPPHLLRSAIPYSMSLAVMRALRPNPDDRFPSIGAFMLELHQPKRRRWPWLLGAMVCMLVVVIYALSQPTKPEPGPWRDAIAGTRIWEDVISGSWQRDDGVLTSGDEICIVKLEENLPDSYDVSMKFTRLRGEFSVALFFRSGGQVASAEMDAWREGLAGVQMLGSEDLTAGYGFRFPLENGRTYEMLVEVRPGKVRMTIDGQFKKEFDHHGQTLSTTPPWEWNPEQLPAALAIGSYMGSTRFEKIEWREVK
jgi:serine/threonine protein kinase